jgi:hypothetical protein
MVGNAAFDDADFLGGVSRETHARLRDYAALYEKWSPRINLTAPSTQKDFWRRHIADSAQLFDLAPEAQHWADLGSGGGFPGMVIAILLQDQPDARVELIESNRKKNGVSTGGQGTMCTVGDHPSCPYRGSNPGDEKARYRNGAGVGCAAGASRYDLGLALVRYARSVSQRPWICRRDRRKPCQTRFRSGNT